MKLTANSTVTRTVLVLLSALIITSAASGQSSSSQLRNIKPNAIANLIACINSDNEGLKKSAVYFAGKYEFEQTVDPLIQQLRSDKNPRVRLLVALALYKIGNEKGLDAIHKNALSEEDPHVKRICNAMVEEYVASKNILASVN